MLKILMAVLFMSFIGTSYASANETTSSAPDTISDVANMSDDANFAIDARYQVQWRDARTGQSISGWVPSDRAVCGHGSNCACGGENFCGEHRRGQRVKYWDQGCGTRPRTLVCDVR